LNHDTLILGIFEGCDEEGAYSDYRWIAIPSQLS